MIPNEINMIPNEINTLEVVIKCLVYIDNVGNMFIIPC